ncbi:hypothetical protein yc1106_03384 [Curvularia clavata]|uniref:F-box domain-containing protein n=1 Tax=Curvularia clavata TaxID=95742 RepID=A0A9Q8Z5M3_CURCL|nr:hypothetical protein yc1106_03384 [Curvularia clavata]
MFSTLQIRPAKTPRRKPNLTIHAGVSKRRVSFVSALSASRVPSLSFMEGLFGDEFPEAFGSGDGPPDKSRKTILDLPAELLDIVCAYISKLDIKRLRLASKQLANSVYLRIDRVYVSPNRANLDYLYQIMSHPSYKCRVREIVWDDTRLEEYPTLSSFREAIRVDERETKRAIENRLEEAIWIYGEENPEYHALEHDDLFDSSMRLTAAAKEILLRYGDQFAREVLARNAAMMGIEESYSLYQDLYREEQVIMQQQSDVQALQQALVGFPNLKRVTFSTEVWRSTSFPLRYNTPFHKSLPVGFRKPSVRHVSYAHIPLEHVQDRDVKTPFQNNRSLTGSQGYSALVSAITDMQMPKIEEFVAETEDEAALEPAPIMNDNHNFPFTSKNVDDTVKMFQRTPLKKLKFFVTSEMDARPVFTPDNTTINKNFLSHLPHLQHLDLSLSYNKKAPASGMPLRLIPIPETLKEQLKTLTLHHILAECEDIVGLLVSMPKLRHVTLHRLYQWMGHPSWHAHFERLKEHYSSAECTSRPNFTICQLLQSDVTCFQIVDQEIDEFLFGDGKENPFLKDGDRTFAMLRPQIGWRVDTRDDSVRERMSDFSKRMEVVEEVSEWDVV